MRQINDIRKHGAVVLLVLISGIAFGSEGMMHVKSRHSVEDTAARGKQMMQYHKLEVFAEVDYAKRAAGQKQKLLPTRLLIAGDAEAETPLVSEKRLAGIDLLIKILIWEDEKGTVWVSYSDPEYLALRHGIPAESPPIKRLSRRISKLSRALAN